jgi:hypothetical protein
MATLLLELSSLEVEPLQIVEKAPDREGFYTPEQESSLESIGAASGNFDIDALLTGTFSINDHTRFDNKATPCCCKTVCCCHS